MQVWENITKDRYSEIEIRKLLMTYKAVSVDNQAVLSIRHLFFRTFTRSPIWQKH